MKTAVKYYRKKPVVIKAIQYTAENLNECVKFCDKIVMGERESFFAISTLEGNMALNKGDYIIQGVAGEFYPCKEDIFLKTYEIVEQ